MATAAYVEDVYWLTARVLEQLPLRELVARADDPDLPPVDRLEVSLTVPAPDLASAVVVQQWLQLAVDAAAIATELGSEVDSPSFDDVRRLLDEEPCSLTIVDLFVGSFHLRGYLKPRTERGNRRLAVFGVLLGAALTIAAGFLAPPVGPIVAAAGTLAQLAGVDWAALGSEPQQTASTIDFSHVPPGVHVWINGQRLFVFEFRVEGESERLKSFTRVLASATMLRIEEVEEVEFSEDGGYLQVRVKSTVGAELLSNIAALAQGSGITFAKGWQN